MIDQNEIERYTREGWTQGRGIVSSMKMIFISRNEETKRIPREQYEDFEKKGWHRGMQPRKENS